ncbi:phosphotransferase [Pseudalkalibacillus hwajinpoensis]|uniref:phosphotransferase n=1 Tax=Guptibacillus hwajinpoensis TaxID=208199 RepID=UPI00325B728B
MVWLVQYQNGTRIIVKGFLKKDVIWKQIETSMNTSVSFIQFIPFSDGDWVKESDGVYFACMKFESGRALNFSRREERQLAFEKIAHFHQETEGFDSKFIPRISLKHKWMNRFIRFQQSIQSSLFCSEHNKLIQRYVETGREVLAKMSFLDELEISAFHHKRIVHGDPAHHNFIFHCNNLRLIDGDLLTYGPHEYDFLQLIIRMLPYCDWSLDEWMAFEIPPLKHCLTNPSLRRLLAYPADFYREWLVDPDGRELLLRQTGQQDELRSKFMWRMLQ